ncbi:MAG: glycosyltransferase family 4 protein, partial [Rubrivivax sp.]|nr:glycosyltransferase family 4 protein [Rubrivivax sp.]
CEAFQQADLEVELITCRYLDKFDISPYRDLWQYYGIRTPFKFRELPSLQRDSLDHAPWYGKIPHIGGVSAVVSLAIYWMYRCLADRSTLRGSVIYAREIRMAWWAWHIQRRFGLNVPMFFEAHRDVERDRWLERSLPHMTGIVAITHALKDRLVGRYGLDPERILVEPDAVSLADYAPDDRSVQGLRLQLGLPAPPIKLIGFAGNLYPGRGGEELIQAIQGLPERIRLVFVGGQPEDLQRLRSLSEGLGVGNRIQFVGHVPPATVAQYLKAVDVLVAPYTLNIATAPYTSPMKIFEYMAARKPMVVGHLPVLEEVLQDGRNCLFVPPGDVQALANGLKRVLEDGEWGQSLAQNAYTDVQPFTWQARAGRIVAFIEAVHKSQI